MLSMMLLVLVIKTTNSQQHERFVVLPGATTRLSCPAYSNSSVRWEFTPVSRDVQGGTIYNGYIVSIRFSGRFNVIFNANTQRSELHVTDVNQNDAGLFKCLDISLAQARFHFELEVLMGPPQCSTNASSQNYTVTEQQQISVECIVCLTGNSPLITRCAIINLMENNPESVTKNSSCEVYSKTYVFDRTMHRSVLLCTVTIGSNYTYTWTSLAVSVTHGPTSVSIHPKTAAVFQHDDKLTCSSDGHPEPDYSWVSGNVTQRGRQFTIDICELSKANDVASKRWKSELVKVVELTCKAERGARTTSDTVSISVELLDYFDICAGSTVSALNIVAAAPEIRESNVLLYAVIGVVVGVVLSAVVCVIIFVCIRTYECSCSKRGSTTPIPVTPSASFVSSQTLTRRQSPAEDLPGESHEMSTTVDVSENPHEHSRLSGDTYEEMRYSNQQLEQTETAEERLDIRDRLSYQALHLEHCESLVTSDQTA